MEGYLHRILIFFLQINGDTDLLAKDAQLLDGRRTVNVAGNQQRLLILLRLQHIGQLTREGRLT